MTPPNMPPQHLLHHLYSIARRTFSTTTRNNMARITFTGGAGKAGKHVIPELLKRGHKLLNLDLIPLKLV